MKILILANDDGGLYKFRKELILELLQPGRIIRDSVHKKCEIFIGVPKGNYKSKFENWGCQVINISVDRRGKNPIRDLKLLIQYMRLIQIIKPDFVLTYTVKPNIYGAFAASFFKIPTLMNITGLGSALENAGVLRKILIAFYKKNFNNAQCVFFQNKSNLEFFQKNKIKLSKWILLPGSGVNLNEYVYEEYPFCDKNEKFLFVGRIMKEKGIEEYIGAASEIKKIYPNVEFGIVGSLDENYEKILREYENRKIVRYYGHAEDVKSFYKNSNAVILPSYHEGMSNVLLEAAAMGRPIIASNVPGCQEIFDEGISGLGVKARDVMDLSRKIKEFIELPFEFKARMGKHGREKIEKEFNRNTVIEAYIKEIYRGDHDVVV